MKRNILSTGLFLLLILIIHTACQKEILIEQQPYDEKITIESLLEVGTLPKVYISKSVPFFDSDVNPVSLFLSDAKVILSQNGQEEVLKADLIFDEYWCRNQPFYVGTNLIQGNSNYTLRVEYEGEKYEATTTTSVRTVELDSVSYTNSFVDVYGEHQGVVIDFHDPIGEGDNYRFYIERQADSSVYTIDDFEYNPECLGADTTQIADIGWFVYSDENADGLNTRLIMEPSHTFKKDDVAFVRLQTLDKNAAAYFDQLDKLKQASLNPFVEPVFLQEQIEGAIGYFGSMNLSAPIKVVFPENAD